MIDTILESVILDNCINYALLKNKAYATASSTGLGNPKFTIDGNRSAIGWSKGCGGWQDATDGEFPDWLKITFPKPTLIDTVVVYTFEEYMRGRNKHGLKDYDLQILDKKGHWKTVDKTRNNIQGTIVHRFPKATSKSIRLWIRAANNLPKQEGVPEAGFYKDKEFGGGDYSRVLEIEAYLLGKQKIFKQKTIVTNIEKSKKGNIAIFKNNISGNGIKYSNPNYLAMVLRGAGYGVTFLDARTLFYGTILKKENFDIFIHPYGPFFPARTQLYDFLKEGGHLISLGGHAFTDLLDSDKNGNLVPTGYDPGIIMTPERMIERWGAPEKPLREQLRIFGANNHILEDCVKLRLNSNQFMAKAKIEISEPIKGISASARTGEIFSLDEEKELVECDRERAYVYQTRKGVHSAGRLDIGANYIYEYLFSRTCSRWISIIDCFDRLGRIKGSGLALLMNYEGMYKGSFWAYSGISNYNLFHNKKETKLLVDLVKFMLKGVCLHNTETEYQSYHQGETVKFSSIIDNYGKSKQTVELLFDIYPHFSQKSIFQRKKRIQLKPGEWKKTTFKWKPERFKHDLYRLKAAVLIDKEIIDSEETGFVIWDEKILSSGRKISFQNNYFYDEEGSHTLFGVRDNGLHFVDQTDNNSLIWERRFQHLKDNNISVFSPVFFSYLIPGFRWGKEGKEVIPKEVIRQMDAQVQLAQRHKIIYMPNLFLTQKQTAVKRIELSEKVCKYIGERYKNVPGIGFYIWDDGGPFEVKEGKFNSWSKMCVEAFNHNSIGRKFLITAEFGGGDELANNLYMSRKGAENLSFFSRNSYIWNPVFFALGDMRASGKSVTCGEFGCNMPKGEKAEHHTYLALPHYLFGMGASMILNWKAYNHPHHIYQAWGIIHPQQNVPTHVFYTYRNQILFFGSFQPQYKPAKIMFVLPQNSLKKFARVHPLKVRNSSLYKTIINNIEALINKRIGFGLIDEWDFAKVSPDTKVLLCPALSYFSKDSQKILKNYISKENILYTVKNSSVLSNKVLNSLSEKLESKEILSGKIQGLHHFYQPTKDGEIHIISSRPRPIKFKEGEYVDTLMSKTYPYLKSPVSVTLKRFGHLITLTLKDHFLGVVSIKSDGKINGIETQGKVSVDGKTIIETDLHLMIRTLDNKDILNSSTLMILPVLPLSKGRVSLFLNPDLKYCGVGDIENGKWILKERIPIRKKTGELEFSIDHIKATGIIIVSNSEKKVISNFLMEGIKR